jgi:LmbE family N-acetylglucosaminyl deacetylase
MNLSFAGERVLAVVAHPDDAEILCAGTLLRAAADGATVGVFVLCQGDKGQPSRAIANLAKTRATEMRASAKLLGAELFLGGAPDGTLADTRELRLKVVEVLRQFKPTFVLAHSPEDYHPDHRAVSALAEAASWFSASRGHKTRSPALPQAPAIWWMDTLNMIGFNPGFYIDISRFAERKHAALACHKSQLSRANDQDFFSLQELIRQQMRTRGMQAGVVAAEAFRAHFAFKRGTAF